MRDWERYPPTLSLLLEARKADPASVRAIPDIDAMVKSIATLRPNPELWRAHRQQLTAPWAGPGVKRHEAMITGHADTLIDRWIAGETFDFVADFARALPQRTMADVLGFPLEDVKGLEIWGNAQVMPYVHGCGHNNIMTAEQTALTSLVIARSKATKQSRAVHPHALDCFATLAMTNACRSAPTRPT